MFPHLLICSVLQLVEPLKLLPNAIDCLFDETGVESPVIDVVVALSQDALSCVAQCL